jgi:hypothetical protein
MACQVRNDKDFTALIRNVGMNFILWLIIGGILGWIASLIMHTNAQQGIFLNIVVGIIGAMVAGFLLPPPCLALAPSTSTT